MHFLEDVHQLFQARDLGVDHVIGQQHREGLVADQFARGQHGMAEAERFLLTHVGDVDHVGNLAYDLEQIGFAALLQHFFQFVADVEVVFDGRLARVR